MARIRNLHNSPLTFAGVTVQPGATVEIANWRFIKDRPIYKAWGAAGAFEVEGEGEKAPAVARSEPVVTDNPQQDPQGESGDDANTGLEGGQSDQTVPDDSTDVDDASADADPGKDEGTGKRRGRKSKK